MTSLFFLLPPFHWTSTQFFALREFHFGLGPRSLPLSPKAPSTSHLSARTSPGAQSSRSVSPEPVVAIRQRFPVNNVCRGTSQEASRRSPVYRRSRSVDQRDQAPVFKNIRPRFARPTIYRVTQMLMHYCIALAFCQY